MKIHRLIEGIQLLRALRLTDGSTDTLKVHRLTESFTDSLKALKVTKRSHLTEGPHSH